MFPEARKIYIAGAGRRCVLHNHTSGQVIIILRAMHYSDMLILFPWSGSGQAQISGEKNEKAILVRCLNNDRYVTECLPGSAG
jgi:hypothetical protein